MQTYPESAGFDIGHWLSALALPQYTQAFIDNDIDQEILAGLTDADLKELGVASLGHRKRILAALAPAAPTSPAAPTAPDAPTVPATPLPQSATPVAPLLQSSEQTPATEPASAAQAAQVTPSTQTVSAAGADPAPADAPAAAAAGPAQSLKLFLSYGRDTYIPEVQALRKALEARGHQVWFDQDQLGAGLDWERRIEDGLSWCDRVVLTMTPHSVRRPDGYCLNELAKALERQKVIIPLLLVEVPNGAPTSICRIQYLDWRGAVPAEQHPDRFDKLLIRLCQAIEENKLDFEGGQQRLMRAIQPLNYASDIDRHVARFHGRSSIFAKLRLWLDQPQAPQIMWLCGGAGLGKSAIAAMLAHRWGETGAVHFCVAGHFDKADPRRAILSIAYQLSTHLEVYRSRLMALDLEREVEKDARTLFEALLVGPLSGELVHQDHPWLVIIDALDEASQSDGSNALAELVGQEWRKLPSWLRLIVSSRPDPEVQVWLSDIDPLMLSASDTDQLADLRDFLQHELTALGRPQAQAVLDQIVERSEGAFQYVVLLLEEIRQGRCNPEDPVELPRGMHAAYLQSFRRRFSDTAQYAELCRPLLELILQATDPTPLAILAGVVATTPLEIRRRLALLGSMVAIHPAEDARDASWDTVRVTHASLRTWLSGIDPRSRQPFAGVFAVEAGAGLAALTQEVLAHWDKPSAKPLFVARSVFDLVQKMGDKNTLDRIALDFSKYWGKQSLARALPAARHAALWASDVASNPAAPAPALELAANSRHHLGKLLERSGDTPQALLELHAALAIRERLVQLEPTHKDRRRDLSVSYAGLGPIFRAQGNQQKALETLQRALALRQQLASEYPDDDDVQRLLGQSHNAIGNLLRAMGQLQEALAAHHQALAIREGLAQKNPAHSDYQSDIGGSHNNIGIILKAQGDLAGALQAYREFQSILTRLLAQEPSSPEWKTSLSRSHNNISLTLKSMGALTEALAEARSCVALRESLVQVDPDNAARQSELAKSYELLGDVQKAQGDLSSALKQYKKYFSITAALASRDPDNSVWQNSLAGGHNEIGQALKVQGQFEPAIAEFRQSVAIRERLRQQDPGNVVWESALASSYALVGELLQCQGDLSGALQEFRKALALREQLAGKAPKNAAWQQSLAGICQDLAEIFQAQGELENAFVTAENVLAIRERLVLQDKSNAQWQGLLASGYALRAGIHADRHEASAAMQDYLKALDILEGLVQKDPQNASWLDLLSDLYGAIGWALELQGDHAGALARHQQDQQISARLVLLDPHNLSWQHDLALSHFAIGRNLLAVSRAAEADGPIQAAMDGLLALARPETPGSLMDLAGILALAASAAQTQGQAQQERELSLRLAGVDWSGAGADNSLRRACLAPVMHRLDATFDACDPALRRQVASRCLEAARSSGLADSALWQARLAQATLD